MQNLKTKAKLSKAYQTKSKPPTIGATASLSSTSQSLQNSSIPHYFPSQNHPHTYLPKQIPYHSSSIVATLDLTKMTRLMRHAAAVLVAFVSSTSANTCYDEVPVSCTYNGETIFAHCDGSSSVYPPVWQGATSAGEKVLFDEECNPINNRRQLLAPFMEGTQEPLIWCCGDGLDAQDSPLIVGAAQGAPDFQSATSESPMVVKNLVLLLRFANHKAQNSPLKPKSAYEQFFNGDSIDQDFNPTGSVKHYYSRQSYGKIVVESVVIGWIDVTQTEKEAAAGCSSLCSANKLWDAIIEGLDYADSIIDMDTIDLNEDGWLDGLTIIHSGFAAEAGGTDVYGTVREDRIWSHKWGLNQVWQSSSGRNVRANRYNVNPGNFGMTHSVGITRLGVVVHELGHFFGLPDLYDTDFSASGIHVYGVMSSSWGVDGTQYHPQSISPWCKNKLGWIKPKLLTVGTNTIYPGNDNDDDEIYILTRNFPSSEAIWIEYRKKHEWDAKLPGGVLIWHSDDAVTTGNRNEWHPDLGAPVNHLLNRVIQADGKFKLEKQPWPIRFDPAVFWGATDVLSDFSGDNTLTPYAEQVKGNNCQTSGNKLFEFTKQQNVDAYTVKYEIQSRVSCNNNEPPALTVTESPTSKAPTPFPTKFPTTGSPTKNPTRKPTDAATNSPTRFPTRNPTSKAPTKFPTRKPTTRSPTRKPTSKPTTASPTKFPTRFPTDTNPTKFPTRFPTSTPYPSTPYPTGYPASYPTDFPSNEPTKYPTKFPVAYPTDYPSNKPTPYPTKFPAQYPTRFPTKN